MKAVPRQALIGAGANLGDRRQTLLGAVECLRAQAGICFVERSPIFETAPVGIVDQPMFLNLAIGIGTTLTPEELLSALLEIERKFGRVRTERWGPRTLDLDLVAFEGEARATAALQLPHPRMLERAFVTEPLRGLLRGAAFQKKCWEELRAQLAALPPGDGVKLCD